MGGVLDVAEAHIWSFNRFGTVMTSGESSSGREAVTILRVDMLDPDQTGESTRPPG